jgi:hypothetical protein
MDKVGFEPTQLSLLTPEASALDHSAICPNNTQNLEKTYLI